MKRWLPRLFILFTFTAAAADAATFICFGDSLTYGTGGPNGGYLGPLKNYLNSLGQTTTTINRGVPGERTPQGLARINSAMLAQPSDYVLLMEGTNDVNAWEIPSAGVDPADTRANLLAMVDAIRVTGRTAIIATVPPRLSSDPSDPSNSRTGQLNGLIRSVASQRGIRVAEVNAAYSNLANRFTYDDPIHPEPFAYSLMSEAWAAAITGQPASAIDFSGPFPTDMDPSASSTDNSFDTNVRISVRDNKSGVDIANAVMTIDGVAVVPQIDTGQPGEVRFTYNPPVDLRFAQRVNVTFAVSDMAPIPNPTNFTYSFSASPGNGTGGDIDGSGRIDGLDLSLLASAFGAQSGSSRYLEGADIDANGVVDGLDLTFLASRFGARP